MEFRDYRTEQRKWQAKFEAELTRAVREQTERLSSLERHRAWLAGAWAAFGVMGTMIAVALKAWLRATFFGDRWEMPAGVKELSDRTRLLAPWTGADAIVVLQTRRLLRVRAPLSGAAHAAH